MLAIMLAVRVIVGIYIALMVAIIGFAFFRIVIKGDSQ